MRSTLICALVSLAGFAPAIAHAQTASPSAPAKAAVDLTRADIDAAAKIGMAALAPGNVSVSDRNGLGPGEMQVIPPGVGHVWTEIADGGIDYMVIRVIPNACSG